MLDGGAAPVGVESTIVACLDGPPRLLRPGGVPREAIEAVLGEKLASQAGNETRPLAPGMLASHYAPHARVRLEATSIEPGESALLFADARPSGIESAGKVLNLSERGDLHEAAARLFGCLRELDRAGESTIAVSPIPDRGLGEAINDRLRRAAADR